MKKKILFVCIVLLASANSLYCQYWQEQIVLKGNVITQCFDENEDVLFSSELSNGKFAVCHYSVEKDSIDKVLLVTNNAVEFLEVLTDGTIMAFQDYQLLKSTDNGESWEGIKNDITVSKIFRIPFLKEINDTLIFWEFYGYHITFDKGLTWDSISYQSKQLLHLEPTFNGCLVGIENEKKYPIFSSDFGKTWEKTNLDTIQLFHFIYSEKIRTIFALSRNNNRMLYKSMNAGKDWEIIEIPTDTLIASYDVDSEGNLLIMDFKHNLYKWFTKSDDIELLSFGATFNFSPNYPFYKESYKTGVFLDKKDNIFYYDIFDYKIYKFDYISKKWLDTVDIIHDDKPGTTFITSSFKFSKQADKVIINSRDEGLQLVLLNNKFLTSIKVPTGAEPTTDHYELGPNGELVFVNYNIEYNDQPWDTIDNVSARYTISKDNGFSRKLFYCDTNLIYSKKNKYLLPNKFDYSKCGFNNLGDIIIIGNNSLINYNVNTEMISINKLPILNNIMPYVVGYSPDGFIYLFGRKIYSKITGFEIMSSYQILKSSNNGISWDTNIIEMNKYFNITPKKVNFLSNGTIFINDIEWDVPTVFSSSDHGDSWNSHSVDYHNYIQSIFIDNKDNIYCNYGNEAGWNLYTDKNWKRMGDTANIISSRTGDIFANIYLYNLVQDYEKSVYSSDYGNTWINYYEHIDFNIISNDIGDVYKYPKFPWKSEGYTEEYYSLYKLIREPNPKPHPLSDTTVYTVFVNVEDLEENVAGEIFIFPNPANEFIEINFVRCPTSARCRTSDKIEIYNVLGERVKSISIPIPKTLSPNPHSRVDISDLVPGVYFVKVGNLLKRFVKI